MFDFLDAKRVNVTGTYEGAIEGTINVVPQWCSPVNKGALALRAESLASFFRYIKATEARVGRSTSSHARGRDDFHALADFDTALDVFVNRPAEVRKFDANDAPIKFSDSVGTQVEYDVTGDFIDMGRFMEEVPECFGENILGNPQGLFCTIIYNPSVPHYVDQAALNRRASRLVRLVDWLETQGIRTEVVLFNANQCGYVEIVVKRYEDAVDLNMLAVVAHSDFFRRMIFRVKEMSATWQIGHGRATSFGQNRPGDRLTMPEIPHRGFLLVSEQQMYVEQVDAAFDKIEKEIEKALAEGENTFTRVF